jgi:hypothetical protein
MSMSRSRASSRSTAMPAGQENAGGPGDPVEGSPPSRPTQSASAERPRRPEWTTQRWRLQVEAEARSRLKKTIRGLGVER